MTWINPDDTDYYGTLVIRSETTPPSTPPVAGTVYRTGDTIGSAIVVYNGGGTGFIDYGLNLASTYYYHACTYDMALNYSGEAETSFIPTDTGLRQVVLLFPRGYNILSETAGIEWGITGEWSCNETLTVKASEDGGGVFTILTGGEILPLRSTSLSWDTATFPDTRQLYNCSNRSICNRWSGVTASEVIYPWGIFFS